MSSGIDALNGICQQIINDSVKIANDVIKKVAEETQSKMLDKAEKTLKQYYAEYTPRSYRRTGSLKKTIMPYMIPSQGGGVSSFEIGVKYDSGALSGVYHSNSYYHKSGGAWVSRYDSGFDYNGSSNGIPQSSWIFNNFLEGIHPITTTGEATTDTGKKRKTYTYSPFQGATKQLKVMEDFVDKELIPDIQADMQAALWSALAQYF